MLGNQELSDLVDDLETAELKHVKDWRKRLDDSYLTEEERRFYYGLLKEAHERLALVEKFRMEEKENSENK